MNPELSQYITALKVKFQRQPRDYQEILQDIASQVPSLYAPNFRKASEVVTQDHSQAKWCPDKGSYDNHGKLYIGKYPFHKCIDESVKPHSDEIRSDRYQDKKRDQAQLKATISETLTKKLRTEASIASIITDDLSSATHMSDITGAGDSFGRKS